MVNKLYEIPEDVARILRNTGVPVITKHYIEETVKPEAEFKRIHDTLPTPEKVIPKRKRRRTRPVQSKYIVEVGNVTPKELNLRKGRRFYGDKAQHILLNHKRGIRRNVLIDTLYKGDKYHSEDSRHVIGCQITNLVKLGVLSYKS